MVRASCRSVAISSQTKISTLQAKEGQLQPDAVYTTLREFVNRHPIWVIGLIPFGLAAFKILTVSQGDPEVFGYLVQQLDIVGLVLSVTLPMVPITIFWIWVMWYDRRRRTPKDERRDMQEFQTIPLVLVLLSISFAQMVYIITSVVVLSFIIVPRLRLPKRNERLKLRYGVDYRALLRSHPINAVSLLIVLFFQSLLTFNVHWLPAEVIQVKGQPRQQARVITVDKEFTTVLNDRNQVAILRTADIMLREPCYQAKVFTSMTLVSLLSDDAEKSKEDCPLPRNN